MRKSYKAAEFKAHCSEIMNNVYKKQVEVTVTKRDIPIARIIPLQSKKKSVFGCMKGTAEIIGEIINPIDEEWDACR